MNENQSALERESRRSELTQLGVSNSEAVAAAGCERAWLWGYHPETHLAPNSFGPARTRGITGHKILEDFYRLIQNDMDYDTAVTVAMSSLLTARIQAHKMMDVDKLEMLNELRVIMERYFEHYRSDIENWEILDIEGLHLLMWDEEDRIYLPMRLDMVVYHKDGPFKGEVSPVDHKFTNDFWKQYKLRLNSQIPLYILALRESRWKGKNPPVVRRGIINQIRTRKLKEPTAQDLFKREYVEPPQHAIDLVFENHLKGAIRISQLKRLSLRGAFQQTRANWGSPNCQFCDFKSLCAIQLEGGNVQSTIDAEFHENEYGYPSLQELKRER